MTYAEPELVTGLQGYSGGPLLGGGGPVGPGVIGMSGPTIGLNSRYVGGVGSGGGSHYSSSLLQGASKFNTIHSSVNKRNNHGGHHPSNAGLMALNHYESAGPPTSGRGAIPVGGGLPLNLGGGPGPPSGNGGNGTAYHMSTLGRSSSVRGPRDPLIPCSGSSSSGGSGGNGLGGGGLLAGGPPGLGGSGLKNPQASKVVDSAYGTTRSSKKVYL